MRADPLSTVLALADWWLRFSRLFEHSLGVILMYHSIDAPDGYAGSPPVTLAQFRRQVALLKTRYDCSLLQDLFAGRPASRKRIVLSFDDGYRNFMEKALPVLQQYNVPATVFVCSGLLDTERFLTKSEVRALGGLPGIEIGNHTRSHLDLRTALPLSTLEREVIGGKEDLEDLLGRRIHSFAYPYGGVNAAGASLVRRVHEFAVTVSPGVVWPESDRLTLSRVPVSGTSIRYFAFAVTDMKQRLHAQTRRRAS